MGLFTPNHGIYEVIYKTKEKKYEFVADEIEEMAKYGRPILVGTISIEKSLATHYTHE